MLIAGEKRTGTQRERGKARERALDGWRDVVGQIFSLVPNGWQTTFDFRVG